MPVALRDMEIAKRTEHAAISRLSFERLMAECALINNLAVAVGTS
jgi:hypothetical protein